MKIKENQKSNCFYLQKLPCQRGSAVKTRPAAAKDPSPGPQTREARAGRVALSLGALGRVGHRTRLQVEVPA